MRKQILHVAVFGLMIVPVGSSVAQQEPPPDDTRLSPADAVRKSQIYNNPRIFAEMSGAKRTALELKFGERPDRGVAFTGEEYEELPEPDESAAAAMAPPPANVLVNNPAADTTAQDTQSETAVVFGSGSNVVAAFNDSGSHVGGASRFTGWALSTNGGVSFVDKGTLPANPDGDSGDPVLARSAKTKTIFLSTLSFNTGHKLLIFRSTNNGAAFQAPVNGAPGFTPATGEQDKQWIAVDNTPGPGYGNVYMFWRNFAPGGGMTFTRSTNDGLTWTPSPGLKLASGGQGAHVAVGRDHAVYAFWYDSSASPREIKMRKSTNQGASFGAPVTVAKLRATGINGDLGLNPGFRTNSFPHVVASPTKASHLFVAFNDHTGSGTALDRGDIYLARSTNGGSTWTAPVKINGGPAKRDQWQPCLAITPDGKRLCVSWYDRRLDATNTLINRFATIGQVGANGSVSFASDFRVTDQSFPPVIGVDPVVNGTYMGDYDQLTASNTHFGSTWGDNRDNSTGHAGKNANVRFARIPVAGITDPTAEPSDEIDIASVPGFALDAIHQAVEEAPGDLVTKPVQWERAFEMRETIAMYQLTGHDASGQPVEVESKGTRVIELEVLVPADQVPTAVLDAAQAIAAGFEAREITAVIVAGEVVAYSVVGETAPVNSETEEIGDEVEEEEDDAAEEEGDDEAEEAGDDEAGGEPESVVIEAAFTPEGGLLAYTVGKGSEPVTVEESAGDRIEATISPAGRLIGLRNGDE